MIIIDRVNVFVKFFKDLKDYSKEDLKNFLDLKRYKINESNMIIEEYLTLIILYRFSQHKSLKHFWYIEKYFSNNCWPKMPSYHRFIVWINRLSNILQILLDKYCENLNQELGIIDSTKIKTTSNYWIGKVFKSANKGYSSNGEFRGFKLHVLIKYNKSLCNYKITSANVHDITPIKEGFLKNQQGTVLADSGYIGKDLYYNLMQSNTLLIAKPKKVMMENFNLDLGYLDWNKYKKIYFKRTSIERYFAYLKENLNLQINKLHSEKALYTHIYSSLLANQWLTKEKNNIVLEYI